MNQTLTALRTGQFPLLLGYASYLLLTPSPGAVFASVWDKGLHIACWLMLTLSMQVALTGVWTRAPFAKSLLGAAALLAYSALLEWAQTLVPERFFSPADILANAAGIVLGATCIAAWQRLGD